MDNNVFLARSYEPVQEIEQTPSIDSNINIDDFNDEENRLSNTKTLKPKINYEIDYFHHSAFDLNYDSPTIILPSQWR